VWLIELADNGHRWNDIPMSFMLHTCPLSYCIINYCSIAQPPTSSWLHITDHSFWYASPCLWNWLHSSLRQPHSSPSVSDLSLPAPATSSHSVSSSLSPSIIPCLFYSRLKTCFPPCRQFLPASGLTPRTLWLDCFFWASHFFNFQFLHYSFCFCFG